MRKQVFLIALLLLFVFATVAQQSVKIISPNGKLTVIVSFKNQLAYTVVHGADTVLSPSIIYMKLNTGEVLGKDAVLQKQKASNVDEWILPAIYKKDSIRNNYKQLVLEFKAWYSVVFRVFDEGVAYRFITNRKDSFTVENEYAEFNLKADRKAFVSYVRGNNQTREKQFTNSFENTYVIGNLSALDTSKLIVLPALYEAAGGKKICIAEADLEDYPGMYLSKNKDRFSLQAVFAGYPKTIVQGGHNQLQLLVKEREHFIAKCSGKKNFPWRIVAFTETDKELADNDLVYKLASPARVQDVRWVQPGKVAWDWWNDWNIYNVNFKAGINNETYKYYIDFAAANKVKYVVLDEGWSVKNKADLLQVVPAINIEELVAYGKQKGVGIILWVGYYALARDMDNVCKHYAAIGVKGFKVDFVDRDDQLAVEFYYAVAKTAAQYNLIIDFHGAYKPTGLNRTYPNVLNFEGVFGLEQMKGHNDSIDMVTHDVTIPFIRMLAGPMDYTQGAMRNATRKSFYGVNSNPMSQGTRCRQLAEYVIFESPLNMMCDNPTQYMKEQECTNFIAAVPVTWDKTVCLDGKVANYIVMARKKKDNWYIGAMTNWSSRKIELDLSFLGDGDYIMELFKDGINAEKAACDYKRETIILGKERHISIAMAPGGGCAARFSLKNNN